MTAKRSDRTARAKTWRDVLPVHPSAEQFPVMSDAELDKLGQDIKAHGLNEPIVFWRSEDAEWFLLDGRNRLEAMERAGVPFEYEMQRRARAGSTGLEPVVDIDSRRGDTSFIQADVDPKAYILSANAYRRHLTPGQMRQAVATLLKATPAKSDHQVANQTGTSPTTVGKERKELEQSGQLSTVDSRTGADGKARKQPATKPKTSKPAQKASQKTSTSRSTSASSAPVGGLTATDVRAATADVEQITNWIERADANKFDEKAVAALDELATVAFDLSRTAGEIAAGKEESE